MPTMDIQAQIHHGSLFHMVRRLFSWYLAGYSFHGLLPETLFMVSRRRLFSWSLAGDSFHGPKTLFVVSSPILFSFIVPWTLVMVIYPLLYIYTPVDSTLVRSSRPDYTHLNLLRLTSLSPASIRSGLMFSVNIIVNSQPPIWTNV